MSAAPKAALAKQLLGLLLLCALWPWPLSAQDRLRVGIYPNPPLSQLSSKGQPSGFVVDVLNEIARAEGWTLDYVPCRWDACNELLALGELDLLTPISASEGRQRRLELNRQSLYVNWAQIVMAGKEEIKSPLDLSGKTVMAVSSDPHFADLKELVGQFDIPVRFLEVADYESVMAWVERGPANAGLVSRATDQHIFDQHPVVKSSVIFSPAEIRVAVSPLKGPLLNARRLQRLDYHLTQLKSDPTSLYYRAQERWFGKEETGAIPSWVIGLFLFVLLLALLLALGVFLLRRQVIRQTGKIRQINTQFAAFMRHLPGVAYMKDAQGRYLFVNAGWEQKNRLSEAEVLGKTSAQLWTDRVVQEQWEEQQVLEQAELVETIEYHPWGDVPGYWGLTRFPILDADGRVAMVAGFGLDVTAQKETEAELSQLHQQLQLILESAGDGILGFSGRGHCTFANTAALKTLGYGRDELTGSHFHGLVQHSLADGSNYPEEHSGIYRACCQGQGSRVERAVFWHAAGAPITVEYSVHPIAEGKVPGAVLVFRPLQPVVKTDHLDSAHSA